MEINFTELQKQRKEEILKNGIYGKLEVVVGPNDQLPYSHIEIRKLNNTDKAKMIVAMETMLLSLIEKEPIAYAISKQMKISIEYLNKELPGEEKDKE